jgi:hypothetical protein
LRDTVVGDGSSNATLSAARVELVKEQVLAARMERQKREGELHPYEEVERAWTSVLSTIRTAFLNMPAKLSGRLATMANALEIQKVLRSEIHGVLTGLAVTAAEDVLTRADEVHDQQETTTATRRQ